MAPRSLAEDLVVGKRLLRHIASTHPEISHHDMLGRHIPVLDSQNYCTSDVETNLESDNSYQPMSLLLTILVTKYVLASAYVAFLGFGQLSFLKSTFAHAHHFPAWNTFQQKIRQLLVSRQRGWFLCCQVQ